MGEFGIGRKGSMKGSDAALRMRMEADRLDARRQKQIANQIDIINRLLGYPDWDAAAEIARLVEALAEAQQTIEDLRNETKETSNGND